LLKLFDWSKLSETFREHYDEYAVRNISDKEKSVLLFKDIVEKISEQEKVGHKFKSQLEPLVHSSVIDYAFIHRRTIAATDYFTRALDDLTQTIKQHYEEMKVKKKVKKYMKDLESLLVVIDRKKQELKNSIILTETLATGNTGDNLFELLKVPGGSNADIIPSGKGRDKPEKGESQRITLNFFRQGKTIEEIAQVRDLTIGTVESHLAGFVTTGEIAVHELVKLHKVEVIMAALGEKNGEASGPVKQLLGDEYSYGEIRAVINHKKWLQKKQVV
jgi:uncharacterized protein YpbB